MHACGQSASRCHWLVPASNAVTRAMSAGGPPFRCWSRNGIITFCAEPLAGVRAPVERAEARGGAVGLAVMPRPEHEVGVAVVAGLDRVEHRGRAVDVLLVPQAVDQQGGDGQRRASRGSCRPPGPARIRHRRDAGSAGPRTAAAPCPWHRRRRRPSRSAGRWCNRRSRWRTSPRRTSCSAVWP